MAIQKLITLDWMTEYTNKLKAYLSNKFYDKTEVDAKISNIEIGTSIQTIRGTKTEIEAIDLTKYPNGTIVIMEE